LDNLVLLWKSRAFALDKDSTKLSASDYSFLQRFLDVTKANLFFARGVMIVEGDAENILLPTLATILGRDFTENGVSIVNVGGVGLSRYARIFMRKDVTKESKYSLNIPVACVTDMDVMPNCAPEIVGIIKPGEEIASTSGRRWRAKVDYKGSTTLADERCKKVDKASGQSVQTFVSDEWTLEYDLALGPKSTGGGFSGGLAEHVFIAACLAENDDAINSAKTTLGEVEASAKEAFAALTTAALPTDGCATEEVLASHVYAKFVKKKASKSISAQYLSQRLMSEYEQKVIIAESLRKMLPKYITEAIDYVTGGVIVTAADEGEHHGK
jgi:putative ATP-dependent endonuclease of OLD family